MQVIVHPGTKPASWGLTGPAAGAPGCSPTCAPLLGVAVGWGGQVKPPRCTAPHLTRAGRSVPHPDPTSLIFTPCPPSSPRVLHPDPASPILILHPPSSPRVLHLHPASSILTPHPHPVSLPLVAGFSGAHCEIDIDECNPDPCHYGTCKDSIAAFTCLCQPGYTGHRCDININECQSQPCKNGGTCQDRNNAYNCLCLKGTTGEREGPPRGAPRGSAVPRTGPIPVPGRVGPGPPPAAALVPGPAWGILGEGEFSRFGARLLQAPRPSRGPGSRLWRRRFVVERRRRVPAGFVLPRQQSWGPPNGTAPLPRAQLRDQPGRLRQQPLRLRQVHRQDQRLRVHLRAGVHR